MIHKCKHLDDSVIIADNMLSVSDVELIINFCPFCGTKLNKGITS